MSVRETLELDLRGALAQLSQVDRTLATASARFNRDLTSAAAALGSVSAGSLGGAASQLANVERSARGAKEGVAEYANGVKSAEASAQVFEAALKEQEAAQRAAAKATREHHDALTTVGTAAGIAAGAIGLGLGLAINAAIGFDASMSNVAAVSGATADEMDRLRDSAIEAGAATVFSAKDAADAQAELAKAGVSTADILGGALTGSLNLATAGQLGLAESATIAAQAMQIFNLEGDDVGHIADVLAAGANKSTASVASLGQGLGNVGGVARLFNLSLEDTVGVLALLDQNAIRGAEGGTALRSALLALATPSKIQREEMEKLSFSAYDAGGSFIGLEALAGQLQDRFGGLTEAERNASLGIIFGAYGVQAASALYREGAAGVREYVNDVNDSGAASRFAATQLDNLSGDLEQLKGSIETALIGAGGQGTAVLRFMAQAATDTVNMMGQLPGPIQAGVVGLAALAAAGLGVVAIVGTMKPKFDQFNQALDLLSAKGGTAGKAAGLLRTNMGGLAKAAAGLGTFFVLQPMLDGLAKSMGATGKDAAFMSGAVSGAAAGFLVAGPAGAAFGGVIGGLGGALGLFSDEAAEAKEATQALVAEIDKLGQTKATKAFLDDFEDAAKFMREVGADGQIVFSAMRESLIRLGTESPAAMRKVIDGLVESGEVTSRQAVKLDADLVRVEQRYAKNAEKSREAKQANDQLAGSFQTTGEAAEEAAKAYKKWVDSVTANLPTVSSAFGEAVQGAQEYADEIGKAVDPAVLIEKFQAQRQAIVEFTDNIIKIAVDAPKLATELTKLGPAAAAGFASAYAAAEPGVRAAAEGLITVSEEEFAKLPTWVQTILGPQLGLAGNSAGVQGGTGLTGGLATTVDQGKPTVVSSTEGIVSSVTDKLAELAWRGPAAVASTPEEVAGTIADGKTAVTTAVDDIVRAGAEAFGLFPGKAKEKVSPTGTAVGQGIASTAGGAVNAALTLAGDVAAQFGGFFDIGWNAGWNAGTGVESGVLAAVNRASSAVTTLVGNIVGSAKAALQSSSPSRVFMAIGEDVSEGLALGIEDGGGFAVEVTKRVAGEVADAALQTLEERFATALQSLQNSLGDLNSPLPPPVDPRQQVVDVARRTVEELQKEAAAEYTRLTAEQNLVDPATSRSLFDDLTRRIRDTMIVGQTPIDALLARVIPNAGINPPASLGINPPVELNLDINVDAEGRVTATSKSPDVRVGDVTATIGAL